MTEKHHTNGHPDSRSSQPDKGTSPVCLVCLVHLVSLVGLGQPNKQNKPNKRDRADRHVTEATIRHSPLLNGMYQPMQPSPPSTKQQVTVSQPTPLIERLRNEAPGQVCPDVPPQPGVQKFARPPPGIRRTDTIRSTARGLATHRTESPPQYHGHRPSPIAVGRPCPHYA